ncbi:hypothetical protein MPTK1_Vg01090 [Marchantia polymorpha subsp. ruderalis]|uniref:Uncharacterized protein n=1 Tax=Marchantia polymorpha TaxID=3197 RepID=A0A2R6VWZ6_MARPO|nr:hypothetical protein MARPO_YA0014 [Marchantia polymorpha]BBN20647.1 hypothetical protein Mp_Vg01090 [Marchantia polymorpha subsp. ruderalis]|eukprot:PTQ26128.1 hypothetical protein MARPO_YA0014 [Marchantia polymorpha]
MSRIMRTTHHTSCMPSNFKSASSSSRVELTWQIRPHRCEPHVRPTRGSHLAGLRQTVRRGQIRDWHVALTTRVARHIDADNTFDLHVGSQVAD